MTFLICSRNYSPAVRAVPDFGSGSGQNPALFPNPAEIQLRQKSTGADSFAAYEKWIFPRHSIFSA